jgi:hypothetical protein
MRLEHVGSAGPRAGNCLRRIPGNSDRDSMTRLHTGEQMTHRRSLVYLCVLIVAGSAIRTAAAQSDTAQRSASVSVAAAEAAGAKLLGVFDANTGEWLSHVVVRDTLGRQTQTSDGGVAALGLLEPVLGQYLLEIRKEGYVPQHFKLRADTAADFLVSLTPNPLGRATQLPAVITTDSRRRLAEDPGTRDGFFARCSMAVVECVGQVDLDKHPAANIGDLLDRKVGITRICPAVKHALATKATGADQIPTCFAEMQSEIGGFCEPTFFVNGFPWATLAGATSQQQLNQFLNPNNISGMEVYLPSMPRPVRYEVPESSCGAVVIWTQARKNGPNL